MEKSGKARCYHNYATALYEKGDEGGAIQYFTKAIERDDFYGEPHINLALIYQNKGDYVTAMEHYKCALEIGEGHPQLFNNLGLLHLTTNSLDKAEYCFKQALVLCPYDSRAFHNLGNVYRFKRRLNDAKQCYLKALGGNYKGREILYSLGSVCFELNEFGDALKALSNIDVNYQNTAFYLGGCFFNSKNYAKAAQCFEVAYNKNPKDRNLTYNYALALLNIFKYDRALSLFQQLKNIEALPYAALHYARCLIEVGNKKTAKIEIEGLMKTSKNTDVKKEALELKKRC
jgi:tetratricopeptide (TPR) repeat protein